MFAKKPVQQKIQQKMAQTDTLSVLVKEKGLILQRLWLPVYTEEYLGDYGLPVKREVIILKDGKKAFKLPILTTDDYSLKGTRTGTIYVLYQRGLSERFKQLNLKEVGMDPEMGKPIQEDMGKVLVKIFQDNLNVKKTPPTLVAGLSKFLFYMFLFSVLVYASLYAVNIIMTLAAVHAFGAATAAINKLITMVASPVP